MNKVKKAVIPVAGYGSRFLPFTKAVPKPMLPILNKPAIQIIAEEVIASGIEQVLFIVGYKKDIIMSHFSSAKLLEDVLEKGGKLEILSAVQYPEKMGNFTYVEQTEQNGTASAIALAEDFVGGEPFAVIFGDDVMYNENKPVIGQLIDVYEEHKKTVIGCKKVPIKEICKYASVEYDKAFGNCYNITKITEKPKVEDAKSDLAPLGRYVCSSSIFDTIRGLKRGANNEYQFTDALDLDCRFNGGIALDFEGTRYDMGDRLGFLKANIEYGLRDESLKNDFKDYLLKLVDEIQ